MLQPLAIQSWCFRHWKTLPEVLIQLKSCGVSAIEICGVHAAFSDPATYSTTLDQCKKENVKIVAIGVEYLSGDYAKDKHRFEFCKAVGVKNMSISFKPEAMFDGLRDIEKLADEFDVNLGIHNHGGYDWLGNPTMLQYIFSKTSKRIGLHLDTAWAIDAKQNPVEMAETFAERLHGIHVKDFIYDRARNPQDVPIGSGNLDLPRLMSTLKKNDFAGPLVIEYEGDVSNPVPALKKCVEAMRSLV